MKILTTISIRKEELIMLLEVLLMSMKSRIGITYLTKQLQRRKRIHLLTPSGVSIMYSLPGLDSGRDRTISYALLSGGQLQ